MYAIQHISTSTGRTFRATFHKNPSWENQSEISLVLSFFYQYRVLKRNESAPKIGE